MSREGYARGAQGSEDLVVDFPSRRLWQAIRISLWDWTSEINKHQRGDGRGLTGGCKQRQASWGWNSEGTAGSLC